MTTIQMPDVSIGDDELFVIRGHGGYSCLGFDVLESRAERLAAEMGKPWSHEHRGTLGAYARYQALIEEASRRNDATGWRSSSELIPQLVGLEGKRVEVVDVWGQVRRFIVGKSTGFIPCHLEIMRRDSSGGCAVTGEPFKSVKVIPGGR